MDPSGKACGFYWTEGLRGLGWAVDAVPTLKGGSTVGIPSPPAVWMLDGDQDPRHSRRRRLQGFGTDWTAPAVDDPSRRNGPRWKLVGNAVSVPLAQWVGRRLAESTETVPRGTRIENGGAWPKAAYGSRGTAFEVAVGMWPERRSYRHLERFIRYPMMPLKARSGRIPSSHQPFDPAVPRRTPRCSAHRLG